MTEAPRRNGSYPRGPSHRNRVYLDNNATTPILKEALDAMCNAAEFRWGNPSSQYAEGVSASKALEWAREIFAKQMKVPSDTVYFTSCGTESNNIVLRGVMAGCSRGRDTIVTTNIEHPSILKTADTCGRKHIMVPVDRHGYVDEAAFRRILMSNARNIGLVSIIMAQNEIGTLQRIPALVRITREVLGPNVPFHTDATQALGKYYIEPETLGIDMLTGSAHKFHGPRGVGILYAKPGLIKPTSTTMTGGGQERGNRAGTENVPAIVAAAVAFKHALGNETRYERRRVKIKTLRDTMLASISRHIPGLIVNGDSQRGLYNTLSLSFPNGHGHAMCSYLDQHGVSVGSGSACHKGKPSETLMAIYGSNEQSNKIAHATIRISLSGMNTAAECESATEEIIRAWRVTNDIANSSLK